MRKIIRKLTLPLLIGMLGCGTINNSKKVNTTIKDLVMQYVPLEEINVEYSRHHVLYTVNGRIYERYEHTGFDGQEYCVQIFTDSDKGKLIDGDDGNCDGLIDAFSVVEDGNRYAFFCEKTADGKMQDKNCTVLQDLFKVFKARSNVDVVLRVWNSQRDSCNEKKCYMSLKSH